MTGRVVLARRSGASFWRVVLARRLGASFMLERGGAILAQRAGPADRQLRELFEQREE